MGPGRRQPSKLSKIGIFRRGKTSFGPCLVAWLLWLAFVPWSLSRPSTFPVHLGFPANPWLASSPRKWLLDDCGPLHSSSPARSAGSALCCRLNRETSTEVLNSVGLVDRPAEQSIFVLFLVVMRFSCLPPRSVPAFALALCRQCRPRRAENSIVLFAAMSRFG